MASKMILRSLVVMSLSITMASGKPFLPDIIGTVMSGGEDFASMFGMTSEAGMGILKDSVDTVNHFGDQFGEMARGVWDMGTGTVYRFNSAVQDTAKGVASGINDATGATKTYFYDNVQAGGRLVSGAFDTGLGVVRGTVSGTGNLLHDVKGTVKGGFTDAIDAIDDFASDVIDSHINFFSAATGVVGDVANEGIENFAGVLAPSRF